MMGDGCIGVQIGRDNAPTTKEFQIDSITKIRIYLFSHLPTRDKDKRKKRKKEKKKKKKRQ